MPAGRPVRCRPPYLERAHFDTVRARAGQVDVLNRSFTEYLRGRPERSLDRYVLLDAQDWMSDAQLNELWREITRTARPGARVIFRTAAAADLFARTSGCGGASPLAIRGRVVARSRAARPFRHLWRLPSPCPGGLTFGRLTWRRYPPPT
jgi:hypothetical protein